VTVISKEENSKEFCSNYIQEFGLRSEGWVSETLNRDFR
jgi:hypothetical protein